MNENLSLNISINTNVGDINEKKIGILQGILGQNYNNIIRIKLI